MSCGLLPVPTENDVFNERKKAHKHKETHRTPPDSDPTLKFFMWGPFSWKIKQKGPPTYRILGCTGAPSFFMWVFLYVLFRFGKPTFLQFALGVLRIRNGGLFCISIRATEPQMPPK